MKLCVAVALGVFLCACHRSSHTLAATQPTAASQSGQGTARDERDEEGLKPQEGPPVPESAGKSFDEMLEADISLRPPVFPADASVAERFRSAVRVQLPVLRECADESRFGGPDTDASARCMCRALCSLDIGSGDPVKISYPPPFAIELGFDADGHVGSCSIPRASVSYRCDASNPTAADLQSRVVRRLDPVPSVRVDANLFLRARKKSLSWTHGGQGAWVSNLEIEARSRPDAPQRHIKVEELWYLIGSCRGPEWVAAVPLMHTRQEFVIAPDAAATLAIEFSPIEIGNSCVAFRVVADVDGTLFVLDVPASTTRFEPMDIQGELIR